MSVQNPPLDTYVRDLLHSKPEMLDSEDVLTVIPSTTVFDCIERMADHNVGSIMVMDGEEIVGIFTERDYMKSIALKGHSSKTTDVEEVMTTDVVTVQPDKPLEECLEVMTRFRFRHLPVVDENESLIGLISIGDCVKQVVNTAHRKTKQFRQYVTGSYSV
ncbi:MAG: CBS domain-containing protein [Bacteroidetes bacterium SW_9_63_38]|nr:MAG: CBS domain-containing protein [Bacteroidetes bacterium SW_9_63_38]